MRNVYEIHSSADPSKADYTPYGENLDFIYYQGAESILSGPAETGKTLAACWKLHIVASKYPGAQIAIVRKTQSSLYGTVLQTYEQRVLGDDSGIAIYGGAKPEWYDYPNGSRIFVGGLDNPDKVLSSERDIIYVNQAEELMPADWETLLSRTTGRAGNMPYSQCIGDCNPSQPNHWIIQRSNAGHLKLFVTTHKDNPTLWDQARQEWTNQGHKSLGVLASLTGPRRARLFLGQWTQAEGVIYETFQRAVHVKRRFGPWQSLLLCGDEGYTNPAVILLIGFDSDGRAHVLAEFYERQVLQSGVVARAKAMAEEGFRESPFGLWPRMFADPSAAGLIAELREAGIDTYGADNRVNDGIQQVMERLAIAGDGLPRLTVDPSCINTIAEFESYVWKSGKTGVKDEPMKEYDHAMDALRYGIMGERAVELPPEGVYVYDERVEISPI